MTKLIIGVGVGCLVLALGVVVAQRTGPDDPGEKIDAGRRPSPPRAQQAQQAAPPLPPKVKPPRPVLPAAEVVKIEEPRLLKYLAVRKAALPAFQELDSRRAQLPPAQQEALAAQVRTRFEETLKAEGMAPAEFLAITRNVNALFAGGKFDVSGFTGDDALRAEIELELMQIDEKLLSLRTPPEEKPGLEAKRDALEAQQKALAHGTPSGEAQPDPNDPAVLNGPLLDRYQELVEGVSSPGFDAFVAGRGN